MFCSGGAIIIFRAESREQRRIDFRKRVFDELAADRRRVPPDQNSQSDFGETAAERSFYLLRCVGRYWHKADMSWLPVLQRCVTTTQAAIG